MADIERHLESQVAERAGTFWHRLRWHAFSGYIDRAAGMELLDVGAGTGVLGNFLAHDRPFVRYSFLEPVATFARDLEARWGVDRNAANIADLSPFAVITLLDVIEHVADDTAFLQELLGRTAPGTLVVVTVPALPRLWSRWDTVLGHYRRYTRRSLHAALDPLGVDILELSYLFPELIPASLLNRIRHGSADGEWPRLPAFVDDTAYRIGCVSLWLRRIWPVGTSLLAVGRTRDRVRPR